MVQRDDAKAKVLSVVFLVVSVAVLADPGAAETSFEATETAFSTPQVVSVDGTKDPAVALQSASPTDGLLVWNTRPADTDPDGEHWTTVVLSGQLYYELARPDRFLFYISDGISWAVCDTHPEYRWNLWLNDIAWFDPVNVGQMATPISFVKAGNPWNQATCSLGPTMQGTSITFRVTIDETEVDVAGFTTTQPVAWVGDLGIAQS